MITEDYVSFEVAKLLKEKGFDEDTERVYERNIMACRYEDYPMPTHQMAMKWLREEYNIIIAIRPPYNWNGKKPTNYLFDVWHYYDDNTDFNISVVSSTIYEEAVEAALKYCLTELI